MTRAEQAVRRAEAVETTATGDIPAWLAAGVAIACGAPSVALLLGFDFGTARPALDPAALAGLTAAELDDALHYQLRGAFTHTILEWTASSIAALTTVLAFAHFALKRDVFTPVVALALLASGTLDLFHTLAADRLISATADNQQFIPFTWAISRIFNAVIPLTAVALLLFARRYAARTIQRQSLWVVGVTGLFIFATAAAVMLYCTTIETLPQTVYPEHFIARPFDAFPLVVYLASGLIIYPLFHRAVPSQFAAALWLSVAADAGAQFHMAFGSTALFDAHFNAGHFLKIVAYLTPCVGLILDYIETYRSAERSEAVARRHAEELAASNEELEAFAYVASHDLVEPLRMIRSYALILRRELSGQLEGKLESYFGFMVDGADRMHLLIHDLLNYSRAGRSDIEPGAVSLEAVVSATLDNLAVSVSESQAEIVIGELPVVMGEKTALQQLFQNLIGNAIKFSDGADPVVRIDALRLDGEWRISISDNGIGMEAQYLEQIFAPFKRLHARDAFAGSGIGLAVCAKVVKRHGGQISVESKPGQGSTFYFTLPTSLTPARIEETA